MKDNFIKVAAITPDIRVGDTEFNTESIIKDIHAAAEEGVKLAVFPELCITGYTCGDLFLQDTLLNEAIDGLAKFVIHQMILIWLLLQGFLLCIWAGSIMLLL